MFSYASQRFRLLFEGFDRAAEAGGTSLHDPAQTSQHASGFALPALFDQLCLIFKREVRTKDPASVFGDRRSLTA